MIKRIVSFFVLLHCINSNSIPSLTIVEIDNQTSRDLHIHTRNQDKKTGERYEVKKILPAQEVSQTNIDIFLEKTSGFNTWRTTNIGEIEFFFPEREIYSVEGTGLEWEIKKGPRYPELGYRFKLNASIEDFYKTAVVNVFMSLPFKRTPDVSKAFRIDNFLEKDINFYLKLEFYEEEDGKINMSQPKISLGLDETSFED